METMNMNEMWPTLNQAHGNSDESAVDESNDNGWEIVRQDDDTDEAIEIQVIPSSMRKLRHCASSPDLRFIGRALEAVEEHGDDEDVTVDSSIDSSAVLVNKKTTSFRDAILSPSKETPDEKKEQDSEQKEQSRPKQKIKPKIVVKPIKRCSKSTGDLRSLVIHEDEVLGESDAMDYYHRKAMGASGRANGLKLRPDEAKRKSITMYKKQMQRQAQQAA